MAEEALSLRVLTNDEAKEVLEAFEAFKSFHKVALNASPRFTDDGRTEVDVRFFKVVEASPKEEGFQVKDNGESDREHAEN